MSLSSRSQESRTSIFMHIYRGLKTSLLTRSQYVKAVRNIDGGWQECVGTHANTTREREREREREIERERDREIERERDIYI